MREKLKDARGETLVEVLAAIVIGALSVILLFSAVIASSKMEAATKKVDKDFKTALKAAEVQDTKIEEDAGLIPEDAQISVKRVFGDPAKTDTEALQNVDFFADFYGGRGTYSYSLVPAPALPGPPS